MASIPWDAELRPALIEQLLEILLADRSTVLGPTTMRPPILSPLLLRPRSTRARGKLTCLRASAPRSMTPACTGSWSPARAVHSRDEEPRSLPSVGLAASLPLRALRPVFSAAARLMGLEHPVPVRSGPHRRGSSTRSRTTETSGRGHGGHGIDGVVAALLAALTRASVQNFAR